MIFNCIKNSDEKVLQLYLYLKITSSGKVKANQIDFDEISRVLNIKTLKIIKTYFDNLIARKWIGYSKKSDTYFIHSFDNVQHLESLKTKTSAVFKIEYFTNFKAWCSAVLFAYLYKRTRWSKYKESASKLEKANQTQSTTPLFVANLYKKLSWDYYTNKPEPPYLPIATTGFSKYFNISVGQASKLKKLAFDAGYIDVCKNFENTNILLEEKELYKKYGNPNITNKLRVKKGQIVIQQIDTILPQIALSKRKVIKKNVG